MTRLVFSSFFFLSMAGGARRASNHGGGNLYAVRFTGRMETRQDTGTEPMTNETGPIYGVPLIDTLPLGEGEMLQQMPSRDALECFLDSDLDSVAAGYEVLLAHYHRVCEERDSLKRKVEELASDNEIRAMETGL